VKNFDPIVILVCGFCRQDQQNGSKQKYRNERAAQCQETFKLAFKRRTKKEIS